MKKIIIFLLLFPCLIYATDSTNVAVTPHVNLLKTKQDGEISIKNFVFNNGEKINLLRLHYITLGHPKKNSANEIINAVMLFHATINDSNFFLKPAIADILFKKNRPLDVARFYIIIPDGIGTGKSTKPSDGLLKNFPHYGYLDQIKTDKAILDKLGVTHLKLVLGTSMGGMQTWLWGETYPDSVDNLVPIVSTPRPVSGRDFIWREIIMTSILNAEDDKSSHWKNVAAPLSAIMLGTAKMLEGAAPTHVAALAEYKQLVDTLKNVNAFDWYFLFNSSFDYNPGPLLTKIKAQLLSINFSDDLLNPPEFISLPNKSNFHLSLTPGGYGHMTLAHPELWINILSTFLAGKDGWEYLIKNDTKFV